MAEDQRTADERTLRYVCGLFVGQLEPDEMEAFSRACAQGWARRIYEGAAGFLGLAKVEIASSLHRSLPGGER